MIRRCAVEALGLVFPSPLGVAAGVDKDATWFEGLGAIGFGFVEIGTVTAQPQPGNPRPRIERFPQARALLNWMGFPNGGADAVAARLTGPRSTIVGVNVGKSKVAPVDDAAADYRASVRRLAAACGLPRAQRELAQHAGAAVAPGGRRARGARGRRAARSCVGSGCACRCS